MLALPRQRRVDRHGFPLRPAEHNREIFFLDLSAFHRFTETPRRRQILRDQDETAGFAIESIHDRDLAAVDQLERKQLTESRPERGGAVGFGRMDEEKGRFVDDKVIGRLRNDAKFWRRVGAAYGGGRRSESRHDFSAQG